MKYAPHEDMMLWLKDYPPPLPKDEQIALARRLPDQEARDLLVLHNMRFVVKTATIYSNAGMPFADLIQEGAAGLIKGIDRYDPDSGYAIITYAVHWIRQSMRAALQKHSRTVRIPANRYKGGFHEYWDLPIHDEESYERAGVPEHWPHAISLNTTQYEDSHEEWVYSLGDGDSADDDGVLDKIVVEKVLARLRGVEREVIEMFYGIDRPTETLQEIGDSKGLTRERIRQIKNKALSRGAFSLRGAAVR